MIWFKLVPHDVYHVSACYVHQVVRVAGRGEKNADEHGADLMY